MHYLIDLDGTLLNDKKAYKDAVPFIDELVRRKIAFKIMTNSIMAPARIAEKLHGAMFEVKKEDILNPIQAINCYLKSNNYKRVYIVGGAPEKEQFEVNSEDEQPEIIVLVDFEKNNISYGELQKIYELIQQKIPVVAASGSLFYLKDNRKYLDTGSFVRLLEQTAEISIEILGKPSGKYFAAGLAALKAPAADVTVIGDDWRTDIIGGIQAGCAAVLVRTGKYQPGDEMKCTPTKTVARLMDIFDDDCSLTAI